MGQIWIRIWKRVAKYSLETFRYIIYSLYKKNLVIEKILYYFTEGVSSNICEIFQYILYFLAPRYLDYANPEKPMKE